MIHYSMFARLKNAWNRFLEWIDKKRNPYNPMLEDEGMDYHCHAEFM